MMYDWIIPFLTKLFDSFLMMLLPYFLFSSREWIRKKKICLTAAIVFGASALFLIDKMIPSLTFELTVCINLIIGLCYSCVCLQGKFYLKLIVQCAFVSSLFLVHFFSTTLLSSVFSLTGDFYAVAQTIVPKLILGLIVLFFIHFASIQDLVLPSYYGISISAVMIIMVLLIIPLRQMGSGQTPNLWKLEMYAVPLLVVLFLYFLFFSLAKEYREKYNYKILAQQMSTQKRYLQESTELYNNMRSLRHELKNHVFYMNTLVEQHRYQDLQAYFHQIYRQEYPIDLIESGNNVVNAVLNQKAVYAQAENIVVTVNASLPETLSIDESKLCAILSNLLDNAIEASRQTVQPKIAVTIQKVGRYVHIVVKNSVFSDVLKRNPTLQTTKQFPNHGIGLQIVKNIVSQYDGMMEFHMEGTEFVANVMLKTEEQPFKQNG